ncbi:hypothetical protein AB4Y93_08375 [Paenibacillus sp. YAF4_2]
MAVIKVNDEQMKMLARLMRAEAEGEGELGMLMGRYKAHFFFIPTRDDCPRVY